VVWNKVNAEGVTYELEIVDDRGESREFKTTKASKTIDNVTFGKTYIARLRAYNDCGTGPISSKPFTLTKPPSKMKPVKVISSQISCQMRMKYSPLSSNEQIEEYEIGIRQGNGEIIPIGEGSVTESNTVLSITMD